LTARHHERNLEILAAIGEGNALTQRALAQRLGVALGLTNLYLKRLVTKGYVKVTEFSEKPHARKRLRYLLTPKGLAEKTRLTYLYMDRSLGQYRLARQTLRTALSTLGASSGGGKRLALYGTGEAAELAYLTLKELGIEPMGVFSASPESTFLGMPVRDLRELRSADVDAVVVATFDRPKNHLPALEALGLPLEKLLTLQPPRGNGFRAGVGHGLGVRPGGGNGRSVGDG
jgi:DNA-binding MarR family transcriptional regulator